MIPRPQSRVPVSTARNTLWSILKAYDVDLQALNGDESYEEPSPASHLIGSAGMIRNAFLDLDYAYRREPSSILGQIGEMQR
jgi:hypothetical protein